MAKPVEYNATIIERTDLTDSLAIFRIKPDQDWGDGKIPDFLGGQYVVLGLNNEEHPEKGSVLRQYSISSPPEEKRWLEFYIRYVEKPESDNPLTHLLWKLKPGDRVHLGHKITGHFTLDKTVGLDDPRVKLMVAAGTGLAPFISMVLSAHKRGMPLDRFAILHGVNRPNDLGYREDLQRIFRNLPERYGPTVSIPEEAPDWKGDVGRVETFFDEEKLSDVEKRVGLPEGGLVPEKVVVYVCGLYGTIHNTLVRLMRRGYVPNDRRIRQALDLLDVPPTLFFEQYDSAPVLDVKNREEMERLLAETPFKGQLKDLN